MNNQTYEITIDTKKSHCHSNEDIKNHKPPTLNETEVPIAFAAPIQDKPDYEHEINKIKQVILNLGEQIVDLHSRIADLENKEQV
ncbi:hypothetical protein OCF10_13680 [Bacillus cereus]|nr:hypothetical protein [Bacillus cereus]